MNPLYAQAEQRTAPRAGSAVRSLLALLLRSQLRLLPCGA